MNETLKPLVVRLAEARKRAEKFRDELAFDRIAWEKAHGELIEAVTQTAKEVQDLEQDIRQKAVIAYNATGDRAPTAGVEVKIMHLIDYDPISALDWARTHGIALRLDDKEFKALAKASTIEFVRYYEQPVAQIATDLAKALGLPMKEG